MAHNEAKFTHHPGRINIKETSFANQRTLCVSAEISSLEPSRAAADSAFSAC
jgi:hypothetical protein